MSPVKLDKCIKKVKKKKVSNPWGICIASTGLEPKTKKGVK